jgi:hypothetical protein
MSVEWGPVLFDAFEMWMLTLDPLKVATESFHHENHRKMLIEHESLTAWLRYKNTPAAS